MTFGCITCDLVDDITMSVYRLKICSKENYYLLNLILIFAGFHEKSILFTTQLHTDTPRSQHKRAAFSSLDHIRSRHPICPMHKYITSSFNLICLVAQLSGEALVLSCYSNSNEPSYESTITKPNNLLFFSLSLSRSVTFQQCPWVRCRCCRWMAKRCTNRWPCPAIWPSRSACPVPTTGKISWSTPSSTPSTISVWVRRFGTKASPSSVPIVHERVRTLPFVHVQTVRFLFWKLRWIF